MLFAITCHDKPGSLALRQQTRPAHLGYLVDFHIVLGGPMLDESGQPCGSMLVIDAPDRAAAETFAGGDPYAVAGLFDRVTVHGFRAVYKDGQLT